MTMQVRNVLTLSLTIKCAVPCTSVNLFTVDIVQWEFTPF